jgi:protein-tyrosine-phosphatase
MLLSRRKALAIGAAFAGSLALAAAPVPSHDQPTRVLFVCQFGSVKSPIARELLRRKAAAGSSRLVVESRGITPEAHLPQPIAERLASEGLDPAREPLRKLEQADLDWADVVVVFNPLPAGLSARQSAGRWHDWTDLGSIVGNYQSTRPDLDARIAALFEQLEASPPLP